jgi:hypothetical protein
MEYSNTGKHKLKYMIPKYYVKIVANSYEKVKLDILTISFPFGISASLKFDKNIKEIAKKTLIFLIDRRILNSKECCGNCIKNAIISLKEIKSDLIGIKKELVNSINSPLYYYVDYIVISINSFLDFMERNNLIDVEDNNIKEIYFDALEKIRRHIAQCLYEIAKIGDVLISQDHYAFKYGEIGWENSNYTDSNHSMDIKV